MIPDSSFPRGVGQDSQPRLSGQPEGGHAPHLSPHSPLEADRLDLDELERLADAATPGPWGRWALEDSLIVQSEDAQRIATARRGDDAGFIAAARGALPALIARLRAAETQRDELSERLGRIEWHVEQSDTNRAALRARIVELEQEVRSRPWNLSVRLVEVENQLAAAETRADEAGDIVRWMVRVCPPEFTHPTAFSFLARVDEEQTP